MRSLPPSNGIRMIRRGEVWLANLNPPHGTEPGKTRPVLIVQSQALLDAGHPSTYVIPLTTQLTQDAEPLRIRVPAVDRLQRDSDLLMDQLRAIDNGRLVGGPLTRLPASTMRDIGRALRELVGIENGQKRPGGTGRAHPIHLAVKSAAGTGRPCRKPCTASQPRAAR